MSTIIDTVNDNDAVIAQESSAESAELKSDLLNSSLGTGDLDRGLNLQPSVWVMALCSEKWETWNLIITLDEGERSQEAGKRQLGRGKCWLPFLLQQYKGSVGLCMLLASCF